MAGLFSRIGAAFKGAINKAKSAISTISAKIATAYDIPFDSVGDMSAADKAGTYRYRSHRERQLLDYRDRITTILTAFDVPAEVVQMVGMLESKDLAEIDFSRMNNALERMERYVDAYTQGYIDEFDTQWIISEVEQAIPSVAIDWDRIDWGRIA